MPGLLTIPCELRIKIAEYLTMNCDKKSICLVCKEMAVVGIPLLYANMAVSIEALQESFASTLVEPETHHGLAHIRTLCIGGGNNGVERFHPSACDISILCHLISAIPENSLTHFSLWTREDDSWCYPVHHLLSQKQHYLTNYQYHPRGSGFGDILVALPDPSALSKITSVHLRLRRIQDVEIAASVVTLIPGIVDLAVHVETVKDDAEIYAQHDDFVKAYTVLLFGTHCSTRRFPRLKSLLLKRLGLEALGSILAKVVDFEQLETLQLIDCYNIEHLFGSLDASQTSFKTLRIEDSHTHSYSGAGENIRFLQTVTVTQELFISAFNHTEGSWLNLEWATLMKHAVRLRSLRVNYQESWSEKKLLLSTPDFLSFCKSASNIQRLALNCPRIEQIHWSTEQGFLTWLDCLSNIRSLTLLELCVWPEYFDKRRCTCDICDPDYGDYGFANPQTDPIFAQAADKVFQALGSKCPVFVALLFRARENEYGPHVPDYCSAFIRSATVDESGQTIYAALPIEPHFLNEYNFFSGIFEVDDKRITTDAEVVAGRNCLFADEDDE